MVHSLRCGVCVGGGATFSLLIFPSPSLTSPRSTLSRAWGRGKTSLHAFPCAPITIPDCIGVSAAPPPSPDEPQISETLGPKITEERPSLWAISAAHPTADK